MVGSFWTSHRFFFIDAFSPLLQSLVNLRCDFEFFNIFFGNITDKHNDTFYPWSSSLQCFSFFSFIILPLAILLSLPSYSGHFLLYERREICLHYSSSSYWCSFSLYTCTTFYHHVDSSMLSLRSHSCHDYCSCYWTVSCITRLVSLLSCVMFTSIIRLLSLQYTYVVIIIRWSSWSPSTYHHHEPYWHHHYNHICLM